MSLVIDVISGALMLTASLFVLLAALGLHRFDDVFSRIHAATKSVTFGFVLVAIGASFLMDDPTDVVKLLLAAGFQLVSAPVGAHILSRAAYHAGGELSPATAVDELAASQVDPTERA
ncbi:MAG: monovalent cation/H(+) antiporter subunit G [Microthrixaceae bacterium]|nr:monovalent cation/H(+) antiporter subunit G [Microthrixaceae bacterium]